VAPPNRRDVLRGAGASAAGLATGCLDAPSQRDLAAAVVEPTPDGLLVALWARTARHGTIAIGSASGARIASRPIELPSTGLAAVDLPGLAPSTAYSIAVSLGRDRLELRARTAPAPTDPRPVRIAVAADIDPSPQFETDLISHVIAAEPELLITLGDFPYTDNGVPAVTIDEYRQRHIETRTSPRVRALLAAQGLCAIYDDHEVINDWDARRAAAQPARAAAGLRAWDEFFPLRRAAPSTRPRGAEPARYRSWRWGAHVECFLLDCRFYRSANDAPDDARKVMLGATQLAWLAAGLAASAATFKVVLTSVPLDFALGDDAWQSFKTERAAVFEAARGVRGVLFVSADQHWFAAHRHDLGIRELQFGPLARGIGTPAPAAAGVLTRIREYNAGLLDFSGEQLTATAIGPGGEILYRESLTPDDLRPR
jgi:alkaline phosphatase D